MADTGQKFIKRNRPPRVHITYEDPYDAEKNIELPFVMGVLADLSGNASRVESPPVGDRKFYDFDMDNFDKRMQAIAPGMKFRVDDKLSGGSDDKMNVELHFKTMDDFSPAAVAKQIPATKALLDARQQLAALLSYMDGKVAATDQINNLLKDPKLMETLRDKMKQEPAKEASSDGDA